MRRLLDRSLCYTVAWLALLAAGAGLPQRAAAQTTPEDYTFTTLAGPREGGPGWYDGAGADARFYDPFSVAADTAGNVYVADTFNHTIRKITASGAVGTIAGLGGTPGDKDGLGVQARFRFPTGIAVDGGMNVYVADTYNDTIRKVAPDGTVTTVAGKAGESGSDNGAGATARFSYPAGVAVDGAGNIYVADGGNYTVRMIDPAGNVTTLAGKAGKVGSTDGTGSAARFNQPGAIAVDQNGNLYVADSGNHTIRMIAPGGVVTTVAGKPSTTGSADGTGAAARFYQPSGITVDEQGVVYVADTYNQTIRKIASGGVVTTWAGSAGRAGILEGANGAARFNYPFGLGAGPNGMLYVADAENHSVRAITAAGLVSTLAGRPSPAGSANGASSAARFNYPHGLALDPAGNVYVADGQNHTIRKITPDGTVSLIAGEAGSAGSTNGVGAAARFRDPYDIARDSAGNLYVADAYNHVIRKIAIDGTVTTLAGKEGVTGDADGAGSEARFNYPFALALGPSGTIYVADTDNHTIRTVTPDGVVSTFAGAAGEKGSADGSANSARFGFPSGIAVDSASNVYVADTVNDTIRKISASGQVTTIAGLAGETGSVDGTGANARFYYPGVLAVDSSGNVFVGDTYNHLIRKVTPAGAVTTLGGLAGETGSADGTGGAARFYRPSGIAVDESGRLYVADTYNHTIRLGYPALPDKPVIDTAFAAPGAVRQLGVADLTTTSYSWRFLRRPASSHAEFSSATVTQPTFTPDAADLYIVRFEGSNAAGRSAIRQLWLGGIQDQTAPTLSITNTVSGQESLDPVYTLLGSAADDVEIEAVWCQLNDGDWFKAVGEETWSASVYLAAGTNTVRVYAADTAGNRSATNSVQISRPASALIAVVTHGYGTISPNYNGQWLELGRKIKLKAKPASGFAFRGWSGSLTSGSRNLNITLASNLTLVATFQDTKKPTLSVTSHTSGQKVSTPAQTVAGLVLDNGPVGSVWYQLNDQPAAQASGTLTWNAKVTLSPGANTLKIYAVDAEGNTSKTTTLKLTYIVSDVIKVTTAGNGVGTVSPNYNNQLLEIDKSFKMTAKPAKGSVFSGWTGSLVSDSPKLVFTMASNLVLQANFATNPFTKSSFSGLFQDANRADHTNSGSFTATVTDRGTFSAKLLWAGKRTSLSGQFSADGHYSKSVAAPGQSPLTVELHLDVSGGQTITGTIASESWSAELVANRAADSGAIPPLREGTKYTLAIAGSDNSSVAPGGNGFGTISISKAGNLRFVGTLGDGTRVSQGASISGQGKWALYLPLYSGRGSMQGWLTFNPQPQSDIQGRVSWSKLFAPSTKTYPDGFAFDSATECIGSSYSMDNGQTALDWENGKIILDQGNLAESVTNHLTLSPNNKITGTHRLQLRISAASGQFKGTVVDPNTGNAISVSGAVLQKQNAGYGNFVGGEQSGSAYLGP